MATREELLAGLNEDLAAEFNAVITYRLFASLCSGPYRQEIRAFFESEIPDELGHAQFLADKIVALGGTPTTEPGPVEITTDNRQMFEISLKAERDTIARYEKRIDQAEAVGETGLKIKLEDLIVDETQHAEEMERILHEWRS
ncbi:MAG: ferritin-like domain-containing protein [Gemmatimonadota bacterium]|jgi:bacterioferritin